MSRQRFLLVVACFLVVSVAVAPFLSFEVDSRGFWIPWQLATAGFKPWNAYTVEGCNYPPVILYVLSVVEVARAAMLVTGQSRLNMLLLKLPNFAAQLVGSACLFRSLRAEFGTRRSLSIAAAWLASPGLFVNAAMWGQWDAILALFSLLAVLSVRAGRPVWTGVWLAAAVATKVQAVFLLPVIGIFFVARRQTRPIVLATIGAAIALILCFAPIAINGRLRESVAVYTQSVDTFQRRTVNAWNPWYLTNWIELRGVTNARQKLRIINDSRAVFPDLTRRFTYKGLALILFGSYVLAMLVVVWRRCAIRDAIVGVPVCGVAMFMLATQMHERYLVPPAALMVLWWPLGRAYRFHCVYWTASAAFNQAFAMGRFGFLGASDQLAGFDGTSAVMAGVNLVAFMHLSWLFFRPQTVAPAIIGADDARSLARPGIPTAIEAS